MVTQIDVLEQHQILLVLSDKVMLSFPLDALDPDESQAAPSKRGRKICTANYFNAGMCNGQLLVCCVRSTSLSSTVKVYEPMDSMTKGKKKSGLAKILAGGQEVLRPYKVCLTYSRPFPHTVLTSDRNFIFLWSRTAYTSSGRSCASAAQKASKLFLWRLWKRSHCSTRPILRSTLWFAEKTSSLSISSVRHPNSCFATPTSPSSSTRTAGGLATTGRLIGRVHRQPLPHGAISTY